MKSQALFENTLLRRFALKLIIVAVLPTILALDCSSTRPESESSAYFDVINQVRTGSRVDLDARGTFTFERDGNLSYYWVLRRLPRGSDAEIIGKNIVNGSFIADMDGEYQVDLLTTLSSESSPREDVFSEIITASSGNAAPVAQAGAYKEVMLGSTVQLDAGGSYDADDDVLGYRWPFATPNSEPISDRFIVNPTFVANSLGRYELEVVANDGQLDSRANSISIRTNLPGSSYPVSMAGPDRYVSTGSLVQLDGSASYSPEGNSVLLYFEWQMLHRPFRSAAVLDNIALVKPSFTADLSGAYVFRLRLTDGDRSSSQRLDGVMNNRVVVFAGNGNIPPRANGGVDANVVSAVEVTLNGSNSSDAENAPLSYDWSIIKAPVGSSQALSTTNQISTSLTPDLNGIYLIRLVVNDGQDDSAPDIVRIIADIPNIGVNLPPAADAGPDQPGAITGNQVTLDGSGSSDPENIPISYLWSIQQQPVGGTAVLSDATAMSPTFTPNVDGEYIVRLVVNDGSQQSLPDEVSVIASAAGPFIALDVITNLPFAPSIPEVDTLMMIDLATSNTLDLESAINVPNGENDEHVALYATFDFTTGTAADFLTNPSWNLISRSHINPVSDSVTPSFIVQRISDSQYYKITMDFTADASAVVQIDAIQAWNCGASEANCPP